MDPVSKQVAPRPLPDDERRFPEDVCSGVAAYRDSVDIFAFNSADLQAPADRPCGESREVLHAAEAFFFERGNKLPVT